MFIISVFSVRKDGSLGNRLSQVCVDDAITFGSIIRTLRNQYPRCYLLVDYVNISLGKLLDNSDLPF